MKEPNETPEISAREALRQLGRAMRYAWPVRWLYAQKLIYGLVGIFPAVFLPWPGKVLVDHVILKAPLDAGDYPFFFRPVIVALEGASPLQVVMTVLLLLMVSLLVFGGWGSDSRRDTTGAAMAEGNDMATRSENVANQSTSAMGGILGWFEYRTTLRISHRLNHHYRSQLFQRIQNLPMTRLTDQRIGDAIFRLMYDTPQITEVVARIILTPVITPVAVIVTLWVMGQSYGNATDVLRTASLIVPVAFLFTLPFAGAVRRRAQRARTTGAETTVTIEEGMTNILAVQGLGGQRRERERFEADSWRSYADARSYMMIWVAMGITVIGFIILAGLDLFYSVTDAIFAGTMSVGDLTVIMIFFGQFVGHASNLGQSWVYLQDNVVGLKRVFELMDEPPDHQPATPEFIDDVREGIRFDDVDYAYPDGTPALEGVSFEAKRGTMVAIVGPAGAGKTTLAQLVPRFLRPSTGRILLDGIELNDIDQEALRAQVAFVFQEPTLFDATIEENIRVGKPDASDAELWRAARAAGAAEFIERFPLGMQTPLGRSGGRLSVGQKQRLSIARALVRGAPVLVLDEPTAALDPETEAQLVATLREVSRDRLVLVIAHRLSTIRSADQILFLQDGQVREKGSHAELLAIEGGAYRHFVELQSAPLGVAS
jgi:ABC-type multidrug transport system fused ATPase/permease subunit